jgi:hypothetical protein
MTEEIGVTADVNSLKQAQSLVNGAQQHLTGTATEMEGRMKNEKGGSIQGTNGEASNDCLK